MQFNFVSDDRTIGVCDVHSGELFVVPGEKTVYIRVSGPSICDELDLSYTDVYEPHSPEQSLRYAVNLSNGRLVSFEADEQVILLAEVPPITVEI